MRVQHKCYVQIGLDAQFQDKVFYPEDAAQQVIYDNMKSAQSGTLSIPGGTTVTLSPGEVAAMRGVYLRVNGACQVSLDGGTSWIDVAPATVTPGANARFFKEGPLTSIEVKTPDASTTTLTGVYAVWGDPGS